VKLILPVAQDRESHRFALAVLQMFEKAGRAVMAALSARVMMSPNLDPCFLAGLSFPSVVTSTGSWGTSQPSHSDLRRLRPEQP